MSGPITIGNTWLSATELQREVYANQYYNTLLSGSKWTTNTLTWSAPTSSYGDLNYGATPQGFVPFSTQDILETQYFLNYLSSIINLNFTYTTSASSNIKLGYEHMNGAGGYAQYPPDGRLYIASTSANVGSGLETAGSYGFGTLIHEFGHVLGLKHPEYYGLLGSSDPGPYLPTSLDTSYATIMSYSDFIEWNSINQSAMHCQSYMPVDIAALVSLYGSAVGIPNTNFTYQFSSTAAFTDNGQNATVNMLSPFYLYDANHSVTLDFSTLTDSTESLSVCPKSC